MGERHGALQELFMAREDGVAGLRSRTDSRATGGRCDLSLIGVAALCAVEGETQTSGRSQP